MISSTCLLVVMPSTGNIVSVFMSVLLCPSLLIVQYTYNTSRTVKNVVRMPLAVMLNRPLSRLATSCGLWQPVFFWRLS